MSENATAAQVAPRGYRPAPLDHTYECSALAAVAVAFEAGHTTHRVKVPRGTLAFRRTARGARCALLNLAGQRVAVGDMRGGELTDFSRTVAEALVCAPADAPDSSRPDITPWAVGNAMKMRRNGRCPEPRMDGSIRMGVPGAYAIVQHAAVSATADGGSFVRLALEGPWDARRAARVADAMLRDLAPEARHLTYTTEPRGWHRGGIFVSKRGGGQYDGASTAFCSCGWSYLAGDRADARWTAKWHRDHPNACRVE